MNCSFISGIIRYIMKLGVSGTGLKDAHVIRKGNYCDVIDANNHPAVSKKEVYKWVLEFFTHPFSIVLLKVSSYIRDYTHCIDDARMKHVNAFQAQKHCILSKI